jgi:hypothetical protein
MGELLVPGRKIAQKKGTEEGDSVCFLGLYATQLLWIVALGSMVCATLDSVQHAFSKTWTAEYAKPWILFQSCLTTYSLWLSGIKGGCDQSCQLCYMD